jgi:glutamyl-tRNA synthetase
MSASAPAAMRLRFAPSPTGHLHVGNARTALFNWLLARRHGGRFILRIEDTDAGRSSAASEVGILEDLRWLGLDWDEGPGVGGPAAPYRQSERLDDYRAAAQGLVARGAAYPCFCREEDLTRDRDTALAAGRVPKYPGRCRALRPGDVAARLARGDAHAIRFHVPPGPDVAFHDRIRGEVTVSRDQIGDPVILRSDGRPAYNFAVVIDDAAMGITEVVRGEDHVSNTPRQILIYGALGLAPPAFAHLPLVMGPDHTPLSKRHGATSVAEFRARGYMPEALVNYLALIGWSPGGTDEIVPLAEIVSRFAIEDVARRPGVFDVAKLGWVDRHYLRTAEPARVAGLLLPHLAAAGWARTPDASGLDFLASLAPLVAGAVDCLAEAPARLAGLFAWDAASTLADDRARAELGTAQAGAVVRALAADLAARGPLLDAAGFRASAAAVRTATSAKGPALFHTVRLVLTGRGEGPELDLVVPAIDRGALLGPAAGVGPVPSCRVRSAAMARALDDVAAGEAP